jgi:hypothetical protein
MCAELIDDVLARAARATRFSNVDASSRQQYSKMLQESSVFLDSNGIPEPHMENRTSSSSK